MKRKYYVANISGELLEHIDFISFYPCRTRQGNEAAGGREDEYSFS